MHQFLSFRQRFAKFKSARLQAAVAGIAQGGASELMLEDQGGGKKKAKKGGGKRARGAAAEADGQGPSTAKGVASPPKKARRGCGKAAAPRGRG
jgi:hypothetical protein